MQSFVVLLNVAWLAGLAYSDVIIYDKSYTIIDEYNDLPARFGPLFPLEGENHSHCLPYQSPLLADPFTLALPRSSGVRPYGARRLRL